MSRPQLDARIHAPDRLRLCAFLAPLDEAEFQLIRDELGVSDSVLSKHLSHLADAGYVRLDKRALNGRQRAWASLTVKGRKAFAAHVAALQQIAARANGKA
jgi:DNA-binding MarR family transcriptional regulator